MIGKSVKAFRVALIDDDPSFLVMVKNQLHQYGMTVGIEVEHDVFDNARDFHANFLEKKSDYQVIMVDLHMVGMDGFELIKEILKTGTSSIVFAITGDKRQPERLSILHKPFTIEEVMTKYKKLMASPFLNPVQLVLCLDKRVADAR